jgi:transglutaminase-like putative cysteine protease
VRLTDHHLFIRPLESQLLSVEAFDVFSQPQCSQRWVRDAFNNIVLVLGCSSISTLALELTANIEVLSRERNPFDFVLEPYAVGYPFAYQGRERHALGPAIQTTVPGSERVMDWLYEQLPSPNRHPSIVAFLGEISAAIQRQIRYQRRDEEGVQTPAETLALGSGSCRDMAVLFIALCRKLGLAARFVSGYLAQGQADGAYPNRAQGSMHAWAEVYLPGAGWKGYDPTNGVVADAYFVPTAVAYEPESINPVQGHFIGPGNVCSTLEIDLTVEVHDDA